MKTKVSNVHFYGEQWSPDFFKSHGLRGKWLVFLNWLRWHLEMRVNWHAMHILSEQTGMNIYQMRTQWEQDNNPPVRTFAETRDVYSVDESLGTPSLPDPLTPAEQTNKVLARLTAPGRSRRYASGRGRFVMYDVTDEQEGEPDAQDAAADRG